MMRVLFFVVLFSNVYAQTEPSNGVAETESEYILLKNAEIIVSPNETIANGSILIKDKKVVKVGRIMIPPKNTLTIDCEGKTIIPSFIELNASIGLEEPKKKKYNFRPQLESSKQGDYHWNEAVHPEFKTSAHLHYDPKKAKELRKMGFGFALSHLDNGIAQGTGSFIQLPQNAKEQIIIAAAVSTHFSLKKGTSRQSYPSSQMGAIALLRQTFYDANWYAESAEKLPNLSLDALYSQMNKAIFFQTENRLEILRGQKIAKEFDYQFNYFGSGNEYQIADELQSFDGFLVLPLNFPKAYKINDPYLSRQISLSKLKHWELAPSNPFILSNAGHNIALSASGIKKAKEFWPNVRKAIQRGLSPEKALEALTIHPAKILGVEKQVGSIEKNKFASFTIYNSNPFEEKAKLLEIWNLGKREVLGGTINTNIAGKYNLLIDQKKIPVEITAKNEKINVQLSEEEKVKVTSSLDEKSITIQFHSPKHFAGSIQLHGKINTKLGVIEGQGLLPNGNWIKWSAIKHGDKQEEKEDTKLLEIDTTVVHTIWHPHTSYGYDTLPEQQNIIIRNATVWTNEKDGIIKNADVVVSNGKIKYVGNGSHTNPLKAIEVDGAGLHVTSGIIDEHSHIAISKGVNEAGQASSAEVSIADVVRNDDINIYRQLSGGVTVSQLLHGSANPIGGQSALIKLKWGASPDSMLYKNAPKFIKFALGENVKQSNWGMFNTVRFPQTRMGVEQVYYDAFSRAEAYQKEWKKFKNKGGKQPHKDLELETIAEILRKERFITCHSYIQSEINMLMHVADSFGFNINTFTHILEGYKVADKMKEHGVGGSTFSDWWAYKYEVNDAIPYNAKLMHDQGIVVAINSDDAEMGRRLNQEAAKAVKYGGMSEENAWKMVTLNPAKLLHIDDKVGSLKKGKDADIVIWSDNPLSINAVVEKTIIEGTIYYDRTKNYELERRNQAEKARIITKMANDKSPNGKIEFETTKKGHFHCNTIGELESLESNTH